MHTIRIPKIIQFGKDAISEAEYPKNALVVTTAPPDLSAKWLDKMGIQDYMLFDKVTPEPSINDVKNLVAEFKGKNPSALIGLGGGSSMDVVKYSSSEFGVEKILIPTTFGTGAEMTTYCVLKFDGKKKLLREDRFLADRAVIDSYFMDGTPEQIVKNSVCDACAQATEGYDSKLGNELTRTLCKQAFDVLYDAIINDKPENYPYGSMLSGMGFGNCSTTLGHALSYVFSNEGYNHGHALAFTTLVAHRFNGSIFTKRFERITEKLEFEKIYLKQDLMTASKIIFSDRKHLDNNPKKITKKNVFHLLESINQNKTNSFS